MFIVQNRSNTLWHLHCCRLLLSAPSNDMKKWEQVPKIYNCGPQHCQRNNKLNLISFRNRDLTVFFLRVLIDSNVLFFVSSSKKNVCLFLKKPVSGFFFDFITYDHIQMKNVLTCICVHIKKCIISNGSARTPTDNCVSLSNLSWKWKHFLF